MPDEIVIQDDTKPDETIEVPKPSAETPATESEKLAEKIREDLDKLYGSRLESLESRLRQSLRQNNQLLAEVAKGATLPKVVETPKPDKDELDTLVEQGHWKEAVSKLAAVQAQEIVRQQQELDRQQVELQQRQVRFEQAKQAVIQRFPDLDPETGNEESLVSIEFNKVLNEQSWLLREPLGPIEAMRQAEERLLAQGVDVTALRSVSEPVADNKEVVRRQRATLSGLPPSRPSPKGGVVTITRSEKEFIDYWGISPEEYVKNKQLSEQPGSAVEV